MDTNRFWNIINESLQKGDYNRASQEERLSALLSELTTEELLHFDNIFVRKSLIAAYTWNLWGAAYVIRGGCSDDSFSDFRSSLLCLGQTIFESAVGDPDSLSELCAQEVEDSLFHEGFQYLCQHIYEERTGESIPFNYGELPLEPSGKQWDETQLPALYPKLFAKHGWEITEP